MTESTTASIAGSAALDLLANRHSVGPKHLGAPGPSAEQRMRSQFFAARGWVEMLDTVGLSGASVAAAVLGALARGLPPHPPIRPNLQGVTAAVDYLLSLMPPS